MKRKFINSKSLHSVGYDDETYTLEVKFTNGGLYRYYFVVPEEYQKLMEAESKGLYVNTVIKPNHKFEKIEETVE